jgi:small subunit ribosomal protein S3
MGQKTNPIGLRLGIIKGWDSNWYGGKKYEAKLVEDDKIRKYLNARLAKAGVSKIIIERTLKLITVTINTARPGIIIGKGGQEVDKLKEELRKITQKKFRSIFRRSKDLNLMQFLLPPPLPSKLKDVSLSDVL